MQLELQDAASGCPKDQRLQESPEYALDSSMLSRLGLDRLTRCSLSCRMLDLVAQRIKDYKNHQNTLSTPRTHRSLYITDIGSTNLLQPLLHRYWPNGLPM